MKQKSSWKNRQAITLLFIANFISGIAQGISMIAIPWHFTQQKETELYGYIYALVTLCSLFWGPYSGTLVDKYNRKKIFLYIDSICAVLVLAITTIGYSYGGLHWAWVALVYLITFLNYNIHYPNLYAFMQEITEKENYGKIMSYMEVLGQFASVLSGAAAAFLLEGTKNGTVEFFGQKINVGQDIAPWQIHEIFLIDGLTYIVGLIIIYFIRYTSLTERKTEEGTVISRLKTGFSFLKQNKPILIFGIASYSIFVTILVFLFFTNPIYVKNYLHEEGGVYASAEMCYALGALFAGMTIRYIFNEKYISITASIIVMTLVGVGIYATLNFNMSIMVFFVLVFLIGIINAGARIQRITYLFRHIPNQLFGRTGSVFFISNIIFRIAFVSLFTLPFFQTGSNIAHSMGILAVFLAVSALVLIIFYKKIEQQ